MKKNLLIIISLVASHVISYSQDTTYVDLGLSVKWAKCNLGANTPEQSGDFYAWGEVETKNEFDWTTYKWCNGTFNSLTKYCVKGMRNFGKVDGNTKLVPEDDVVCVKLGGKWRMPTKDELDELLVNCTCEWKRINNVNGIKLTSKINGNNIFLPAAGYYFKSLGGVNEDCYYWSSSLDSSYSPGAVGFVFINGKLQEGYPFRCMGISVRPVLD